MVLRKLVETAITEIGSALSCVEIVEYAKENNLLNINSKTPEKSVCALIYTDIKNNPDTKFIQVSKRPTRFAIKGLNLNKIPVDNNKKTLKIIVKMVMSISLQIQVLVKIG